MSGIRFEDQHSIGDLIGPKQLKFLGYSHNEGPRRYYLFECPQCSNSFSTRCNRVERGGTSTCGRSCSNKKETESDKPLYRVHRGMLNRCNNSNQMFYKDYGARGIIVCEAWYDYQTFKAWALSNGYKKGLTIERINVNGNYEPTNCKWATYLEQGSNTRRNKYCLLDGERMIISEAARRLNLSNKTLAYYKSFPQYNKIPDRIVFE